jgi:transmembrane sensor
MLEQKYTKIEDFLQDNFFVEWVIGNSNAANVYWENFQLAYPEKKEIIANARLIILSFKVKPVYGLTDQETDQIINKVHQRTQIIQTADETPVAKKWEFRSILKYAAVIAIVFSAGLFYNSLIEENETVKPVQLTKANPYKEIVNSSAGPQLIKLPDHSSVILKPGAHLRYQKDFQNNKREVYLTGIAFFEVSKDAKRPFFVYSDEMKVMVLGTSFCVKANKTDDVFKVVVSTGKVSVSAESSGNKKKGEQNVLLTPNQQAVLYRKDMLLKKSSLHKPSLLSKESTKIHFNFIGAPFSEVVSTIKKAYDVDIIYNENQMRNCSLTASLIDQPLDERLRLICKAVEADYRIIGGRIIIEGKGCMN